jgi:hypothetical protein
VAPFLRSCNNKSHKIFYQAVGASDAQWKGFEFVSTWIPAKLAEEVFCWIFSFLSVVLRPNACHGLLILEVF